MSDSNRNSQPQAIELEVMTADVQKRPVSFYDNKSLEEQPLNSSNNNDKKGDENRSQINFLNTTVPQNIMVHDIIGKHTPTRNSLRHSRLITLNRSVQAPNDVSIVLKYQNLARVLLICTVIIGLALCIQSLWLIIWTPNLRLRDNPGWSGIPVLISSFAGLLFISSIPKGYSGRKFGYWRRFLKYISLTLSAIAAGTSVLIFVFSLLHLIDLSSMVCNSNDKLDVTCLCQYNATEETIFAKSYHYVDLNCAEVKNILTILIIFACVASGIVLIFKSIYLNLHWISRNVYEYSRVPVNALNIHLSSSTLYSFIICIISFYTMLPMTYWGEVLKYNRYK